MPHLLHQQSCFQPWWNQDVQNHNCQSSSWVHGCSCWMLLDVNGLVSYIVPVVCISHATDQVLGIKQLEVTSSCSGSFLHDSNVNPPLLSRPKYLYLYHIDCHDILSRWLWYPADKTLDHRTSSRTSCRSKFSTVLIWCRVEPFWLFRFAQGRDLSLSPPFEDK